MLPNGFQSAALFCGIKASKKKDLGIIFSDVPCEAAAVFTTNSVKAHCVLDNQNVINSGSAIRAIIVNSGNANACTGEVGLKALKTVKQATATTFQIPEQSILTASTGIIGVPLPAQSIVNALPELKNCLNTDCDDFAEAILTTDLKIKTAYKQLEQGSLMGITKGSGMINPNMATMLAFIVTDCNLNKAELQQALQEANAKSFNQISVDGDTSTNDMVLLLANGASFHKPNLQTFTQALTELCINLAKQIVLDGEGATKIFEVKVSGAINQKEAESMARGVVSSSLVKSAIFGNDPNWGRLLAAAGQHGEVQQEKASVKIFETFLMREGQVCQFNKPQLSQQMKEAKEIQIELQVGTNLDNAATAWGCDLTYEYVRINAEYTT